jgi:XTP/dITP diphosphohydrolase
MSRLVIATNNRGKIREFADLLNGLGAELLLPSDLGHAQDVAETGETYTANARLKAAACARATGLPALGDDSGLEVDALAGRPGLHSARYAGPGKTDAERRAKLMEELRGVPPPRAALFRSALAVALPSGRVDVFEGMCAGEIIFDERGMNGFGYDPIFFMPEYGLTMAELSDEMKNRVSHRGRAVQAALPYLREILAK